MRQALPAALAALIGAGLLAACASTDYAKQEDAQRQAEIAARQGASVSQVCFTRNIDSWRALGRNAVLIRKGLRDWYKLDLVGTCEPEWAILAIGIRSPAGSSCISRGDRVDTFSREPVSTTCMITDIHIWNDKAPVPPPAKQTSSSGQ